MSSRTQKLTICNSVFGDARRVFPVPSFIQLDLTFTGSLHTHAHLVSQCAEIAHMHAKLFDCSTSEGIAGGNQHPQTVLQQPKAHFGQVGRFAHTVDPDKSQRVWVWRGIG